MYEAESSSPITVGRRVGKIRGPDVVWLLSAVTLIYCQAKLNAVWAQARLGL